METGRRKGVASVIGTVFFVVVFLLAIGSLAYASALQAQASAAELQAQSVVARHETEALSLVPEPSGVTALDEGPSAVAVKFVILRFPNGTVYTVPAAAEIPSGGAAPVRELVSDAICSPAGATCLSEYDRVVSGNPPGSTVGVVTSLGNAFWYTYTRPQPPPGAPISAWVRGDVTTFGDGLYVSTTLAVALAPGGTYAFTAYTAVEPTFGIEYYNFEVHALPPGADLIIACTPMSNPQGGGNQPTDCSTMTGAPLAAHNDLGFGVAPPVFQTPGIFGVVKMGGTGGTLQIDFACVANCGAVTIKAGSYLTAVPVG